MNQTKPKRTTETLPSLREDVKHLFTANNRRETRTPELRSKTPRNKNGNKNKKTPIKQNHRQQFVKEPVESAEYRNKEQSFMLSSKDQPTLSSTVNIKIPSNIQPCKSCSEYQLKVKELAKDLNEQNKQNRDMNEKYLQLKDSYEKRVRKYKVKNRLLKDELKLLKWILGERKQFHQVLEQLEIFKASRGKQANLNVSLKKQPQTSRPIAKPHPPSLLNTFNPPSVQLQPFTPREPSQLEQQINILQQQVMELSIKNEFLQKLKHKPQTSPNHNQQPNHHGYSFSNHQPANSFEFGQSRKVVDKSEHIYRQNQEIKGSQRMPFHYLKDLEQLQKSFKPQLAYQYSDDDQSLSKQKDPNPPANDYQAAKALLIKQNCWNAVSKQPKAQQQPRPQVQSRYTSSPLKQILIQDSMRESSNKKQISSRKQSKIQCSQLAQIPQSRSKYCDSIKERSRLLGL